MKKGRGCKWFKIEILSKIKIQKEWRCKDHINNGCIFESNFLDMHCFCSTNNATMRSFHRQNKRTKPAAWSTYAGWWYILPTPVSHDMEMPYCSLYKSIIMRNKPSRISLISVPCMLWVYYHSFVSLSHELTALTPRIMLWLSPKTNPTGAAWSGCRPSFAPRRFVCRSSSIARPPHWSKHCPFCTVKMRLLLR